MRVVTFCQPQWDSGAVRSRLALTRVPAVKLAKGTHAGSATLAAGEGPSITCGTLRCRSGSTLVFWRRRSRSGLATASTYF